MAIAVPTVIIPRFTSFAGATTFTLLSMEVARYRQAQLVAWRSPIVGASGTFGLNFKQSNDNIAWSTCGGTIPDMDPTANTELAIPPDFTKRFFRVEVVLGGTNPLVTCWMAGQLIQRVD